MHFYHSLDDAFRIYLNNKYYTHMNAILLRCHPCAKAARPYIQLFTSRLQHSTANGLLFTRFGGQQVLGFCGLPQGTAVVRVTSTSHQHHEDCQCHDCSNRTPHHMCTLTRSALTNTNPTNTLLLSLLLQQHESRSACSTRSQCLRAARWAQRATLR